MSVYLLSTFHYISKVLARNLVPIKIGSMKHSIYTLRFTTWEARIVTAMGRV